MLGWLANTVRMDVSYAYSRIAQHSANPTVAALKAVRGVFRYLLSSKTLAITIPLAAQDRDVFDCASRPEHQNPWRFCSDTDHAGNAEVHAELSQIAEWYLRLVQRSSILLAQQGIIRGIRKRTHW